MISVCVCGREKNDREKECNRETDLGHISLVYDGLEGQGCHLAVVRRQGAPCCACVPEHLVWRVFWFIFYQFFD